MSLRAAPGPPHLRWRDDLVERLEAGSRLVETSRGPVEIADVGEGQPVLFVHGAPGGSDLAHLIARQFGTEGVRWIGPSRPGYLRTPLSVGESLPDQADALAALLDALGLDRVPILAHSTGGAVALHFAARHPERCAGIAIASGVSRPLSAARAARFAAGSFPSLLAAAELPGRGSVRMLRGLNRSVARLRRTAEAPRQLAVLPDLAQAILPTDLRTPGFTNDVLQLASLPDPPYAGVRCPIFLIHGVADIVVPAWHSREMSRHLKVTQLRFVPTGQHYVLYVLYAARRREILAFLHDCVRAA